jgi:pyridoxine 5-phosphate synthase
MIRLHVNIDHVATLRNQRDTPYPSVLTAAETCLLSGADGITVHLREDRRHIRDRDVTQLRALMGTAGKPTLGHPLRGTLNLEMAASGEMGEIAGRILPDVVTLVPEKREERTTEGGLDVIKSRAAVEAIAKICRASGIRLSLFIEADPAQIRASQDLGAEQVEFHTGHYAETARSERDALLPAFRDACHLAHELGLAVAAGHGLNTENVGLIAALPHMEELNIGHSVISDAIFQGLQGAVRSLRSAIQAAS